MGQALREQKPGQNLMSARRRQSLPAFQEHPLEMESRLKREEADARWRRQKEMIVIGSAAYISLGAFTVWAIVLLSGSYSSTDKMLLSGFIIQLLTNLFLFVADKKPHWKK